MELVGWLSRRVVTSSVTATDGWGGGVKEVSSM